MPHRFAGHMGTPSMPGSPGLIEDQVQAGKWPGGRSGILIRAGAVQWIDKFCPVVRIQGSVRPVMVTARDRTRVVEQNILGQGAAVREKGQGDHPAQARNMFHAADEDTGRAVRVLADIPIDRIAGGGGMSNREAEFHSPGEESAADGQGRKTNDGILVEYFAL